MPQNTSFSLLKLAKPETDVCQCAVYSRGSHPHDAERFTPQQQSDQHRLLLHRAASLITSSPELPFPSFFGAQCSLFNRMRSYRRLASMLGLGTNQTWLTAHCRKLSGRAGHDRHVLSQQTWEGKKARKGLSVC